VAFFLYVWTCKRLGKSRDFSGVLIFTLRIVKVAGLFKKVICGLILLVGFWWQHDLWGFWLVNKVGFFFQERTSRAASTQWISNDQYYRRQITCMPRSMVKIGACFSFGKVQGRIPATLLISWSFICSYLGRFILTDSAFSDIYAVFSFVFVVLFCYVICMCLCVGEYVCRPAWPFVQPCHFDKIDNHTNSYL